MELLLMSMVLIAAMWAGAQRPPLALRCPHYRVEDEPLIGWWQG